MATTSISPLHPSIALLRKSVEEKYGAHLSPENIESFVEDTLKGQLSADTIRQLWGWRKSSYKSIRRSTLNVLAKYVGDTDWDTYVDANKQRQEQESELIGVYEGIMPGKLSKGQIIHISWQPNRCASLIYDGNEHFHIASVKNSSMLKEGDEFDCCILVVGEPAFLTNLIHDGINVGGYTLGRTSGITAIAIDR